MATGLRWTKQQLHEHAKNVRMKAVVDTLPFKTYPLSAIEAKAAKYRNRKTETEHGKFDSQKEAARYAELVLLERAGKITQLRRQVPYALVVNGVLVCQYISDFTYSEGARLVCEDSKGVRTPVFILKKKLMLACHSIEVKET